MGCLRFNIQAWLLDLVKPIGMDRTQKWHHGYLYVLARGWEVAGYEQLQPPWAALGSPAPTGVHGRPWKV